jgi:protein gp37
MDGEEQAGTTRHFSKKGVVIMSKSKIEWCDKTWNPVTGCTPISKGCANCYAKRMAERFAGPWGLDPANPFAVKLHPERLDEPKRWKKRSKIFVCSMSDLFHEDVPDDFIVKVFETMSNAQWFFGHTFLVLTKRPERMKLIIDKIGAAIEEQKKPVRNEDGTTSHKLHFAFPLQNIWLGVTAENQEQADARIPILLSTPAAKRFVSVEPMLGPVEISNYLYPVYGEPEEPASVYVSNPYAGPWLDWVICGGESGPGARPIHPDWARSLRDQCNAAGTPFMFKQWGEWSEADLGNIDRAKRNHFLALNGNDETNIPIGEYSEGTKHMVFIGKKAAGRLLDCELWDQYPDRQDVPGREP